MHHLDLKSFAYNYHCLKKIQTYTLKFWQDMETFQDMKTFQDMEGLVLNCIEITIEIEDMDIF